MARSDVPELLLCASNELNWTLSLFVSASTAELSVRGRTTAFDVVHDVSADPGPWPRAYTLLAQQDTAIALIEPTATPSDWSLILLTQDRGLPVVWTATCHPS